jgi:hypothetical protein
MPSKAATLAITSQIDGTFLKQIFLALILTHIFGISLLYSLSHSHGLFSYLKIKK